MMIVAIKQTVNFMISCPDMLTGCQHPLLLEGQVYSTL